MTKRARSPNYPSVSLSDAIERLKKLGGKIHSHPAPRDVVLTSMGYTGVNGASLTALAALRKYGLLRRDGEDFRITERGLMYLHPQSVDERSAAIRDAAAEPKLFAELNERFSGGKASDELIRSFLVRNGFTPSASAAALRSYRETMALVERECGEYDSEPDEPDEEFASMELQQSATPVSAGPGPHAPVAAISVEPAPPSKDPFEVTVTDKIKGWFRFDNQDDLDDLISVLNAVRKRLPQSRKKDDEADNSEVN